MHRRVPQDAAGRRRVAPYSWPARPDATPASPQREAAEAGLDDPALSDEDLIAGMVANPITIERPILVTADRAALGRPPEAVLALL